MGLKVAELVKSFSQRNLQENLDYLLKLDRKTQIKLGLVVVAVLFVIVFVIWPAWVSRYYVNGEIQSLQYKIQSAKAKIAQEPALIEEGKRHSEFIESIKLKLLKGEEKEGMVGILSGIAEKNMVTLLRAEPQEEERSAPQKSMPSFETKYRKVSYLATLEGNYHELAGFVSGIENHAKILRVGQLSIAPKEETPRIHLGQVLVSGFGLRGETEGKVKG